MASTSSDSFPVADARAIAYVRRALASYTGGVLAEECAALRARWNALRERYPESRFARHSEVIDDAPV